MYKLLGRATSGNVQKVIFLFKEMDVPFERTDYGRQFENTTTPEYLAMNPTQKVPTLVDGDLSIWESHTILRYLASKEKSALLPTDLAARTQVERWMDWLLAALNSAYLGGFRDAKKPEAERAPDTVKNLVAELAVLEKQLAKNAGWQALNSAWQTSHSAPSSNAVWPSPSTCRPHRTSAHGWQSLPGVLHSWPPPRPDALTRPRNLRKDHANAS